MAEKCLFFDPDKARGGSDRPDVGRAVTEPVRSGAPSIPLSVSALVAQIKNALAVISESAGLMEDLLLATERGMPLDESRLKKSIKRIQAHVERGDGIIRNMNAFAHSVDQQFRQSDVSQVMLLSAALVKRMLDMQGISLNTATPSDPVFVTTAPFFLKNLTWLLLEFAAERLDDSRSLCLAVEKAGEGADICYSELKELDRISSDSFPSKPIQFLLDLLESRLEIDAEGRRLILKLRDLSGED